MSVSNEQELEAAIAALEKQRTELGNHVVDTAIETLQARLETLKPKNKEFEPEQRLKQVSVLFTDIVGSTVIARQLDPEDTHKIMDSSLAILTTIIEQYHGRVLQYAGDSLLAAFGADDSHEEDPENAVRAGLAFLQASKEISRKVELQHGLKGFNIRVGINTGRVLLGGGVDAENSIRGITVHIAARMEQNAPAGGIRISHNTYRHIRGIFDVSKQPPIDIKGLSEPISTYLVHAIKPRSFHNRSRGIDGIETRMIGRERELLQLQQSFHALYQTSNADNPATTALTIVAEAGIGKSRLLYEFINWTDTREEAYYLFKGSAQAKTRQQPYGLLYDILAWRLQINENDSAEIARQKLLQMGAQLFAPEEAGQIDILGHLVGLDFSASPHLRGVLDNPQQIRHQGFFTAAQIFKRLAQHNNVPIVLILDDLQWSDDDSLDFIDYLLDINRDIPILILCMTRPELYERFPEWPSSDATPLRITLQSLDQKLSHELANELLQRLGKIPESMREMVTSSAEGNPFYMEELVKMLIDNGVIISDAGQWRLAQDKILDTQVPDTLTGVIQARLDNLSVSERAALQRASVIGFEFWDSTLAKLDENSVACLPALVQREFIVPQTVSTFEGAREYRFHHHILYQVTYESLLKHDRRNYHLSTASWFENLIKTRGGDYLGVTASHYEQAGDTKKASHYYARAAKEAASRHGRDATLQYVLKALPLIDRNDHELRWQLLIAREKIRATQDNRAEHEADLDALQTTANALDADNLRAEVLLRRAMALSKAGNYPVAEKVSRSALSLANNSAAVAVAALAHKTQAFCLRRMGNFSAAQLVAEAGLRLARESGDRTVEGELITSLSSLAVESGDFVECFRLDKQNLSITRKTGDRAGESSALNTLGDNTLRIGDYVQAKMYFDEALSLSRNIGHRSNESVVLLNLAAIENLQQDYTKAIKYALDSISISSQSSLRDLEAAALLPLGLARIELGEMQLAREALERSRDLFEKNFGLHLSMEPIAGLAHLALKEGNIHNAIGHVEKILEYLENSGSLDGTEEQLRIRWTLFNVLQQAGDKRADAILNEARRQLQIMASQITDTRTRREFVENVPHNKAIESAWQKSINGN